MKFDKVGNPTGHPGYGQRYVVKTVDAQGESRVSKMVEYNILECWLLVAQLEDLYVFHISQQNRYYRTVMCYNVGCPG